MGLDIYLYKYEDFEDTQRKEKDYNSTTEAIWEAAGDYDSLTQEIKDEIRNKCKEYALGLDLGEYGEDPRKESVQIDHPDYPDHYFKIGYFRSSYNEGGIEKILKNLGLPTMRDIFRKDDEEYAFQPDWQKTMTSTEELIERFKVEGAYRIKAISHNIFKDPSTLPKSAAAALDIFKREIDRGPHEYNYSNSDGEFCLHENEKVLAFIPGMDKIFRESPCIYVVTESDNTWYIQALEIVRDTCKYVLEQPDKEKYYLHWSG